MGLRWCASLINSVNADADDRLGHEIVASIAESRLTSRAASRVSEILDYESMSSASTWADDVRYSDEYAWSYTLHWVNPVHSPPSSCSFDYDRDCVNDFCVVSAVQNFTDQLAGRLWCPSEGDALRFLIHFVEDMHQPMHVCGIHTGGNDFDVKFYGSSTNMHALWDSKIIYVRRRDHGIMRGKWE